MKFFFRLFGVLFCCALAQVASAETSSLAPAPMRERLSLDQGWLFHLGDIPFPVVKGHDATYQSTKAGRAPGAAAPDFDDTTWRQLDLPHDWVSEAPFDQNANISQGYRPRGFAWYRRHFQLAEADRGRHLELQFDGVATHCTVWVNGILAHRNWCGYTSFTIDLTSFANYGEAINTIAVRVDADAMEGWWYEGGGIYRHTWLVKRDPVHVVTDGVYANPVRQADGLWLVPVEATIANSGRDTAAFGVEVTLVGPNGKLIATERTDAEVNPLEETVAKLVLPVASPHLWSVDDPALYAVRTIVTRHGAPVDAVTTGCGFRTLRFDAGKGFFLNDQPLKIQGVCNHQDHAGVGVAVPDSLWEFRLRQLKEMGVNAYRCAHNPPAAEFLDACDRMGILVMDENRIFNPTPEYIRQLEWLVCRDRNHPSVFLWSVFNEEPMQATENGYEMVRQMSAVVKRLDSTRLVTAAQSWGFSTPVNVSQAVDLVGFNYEIEPYDSFHAAHPTLPMTSSEDTSAYMTRGEYVTDPARHIVDSYDGHAASWGATHRATWKAIDTRPYLAGSFVWTGFDYHGEPTPYDWPSVSSFFGCLDLCGFPKVAFYLHQAQWIKNRPVLHLIPHWNWPGREGRPVKVMVATNADKVALSLNGKAVGEKSADKYEMVSWEVPYAPGRLEAVAFKNGGEIARSFVETTGTPVALRLLPDRPSLAGDGEDAQPITVEAIDAEGRPVPTANFPVEFELTGPGAIVGLGNGDPNSHEPEKGNHRSLFNGLAQVIVQSTRDGSGALVLRAKTDNLRPAELSLAIDAAPDRPAVPVARKVFTLQHWRMSPITAARPNPLQIPADNDMNSWTTVEPGNPAAFVAGNWAVASVRFSATDAVRQSGGRIVFSALAGRAEMWLDGVRVGYKSIFDQTAFDIALPLGNGEHTLNVLFESQSGVPAGFAGAVTIER